MLSIDCIVTDTTRRKIFMNRGDTTMQEKNYNDVIDWWKLQTIF